VSADLAAKIRLGLEEFATIREQMSPLIAKQSDSTVSDIETAAASAMLHSFYTEIEKILKLIAREWDARMPSSDAWHKELLNQMSAPTNARPAVITSGLVEILSEFLAFRHLFRGASIALMRWDKLAPLVAKVDQTYLQTLQEMEAFLAFLQSGSKPAQ
jgi:hypothetical protein